ncbi:condensin complex subunit 3-like [Acipenser oxyrinchus oxyrinchus]|uniref:Condensin complex subunit 3-like n=1 Tax=Acipenser oxyrinchus oxyrinchus TaxID=40147 RepID=A0AAD8GJR9_ACIOX|nr:condensin complex subunit 3-like [Acipenser oxyrinchus oxyrinchus]
MKMVAGNKVLAIKEAFEKAQKTHNNKARLVSALKQIYNKLEDKTIFHEEFVYYLKFPMIVYKREPAVESVIDFAAKFATSFEELVENEEANEDDEVEDNPFLNYLFYFLLKSHNANCHGVRFRVCQLINKLLGSMPENAQIDDDLFDRIHEAMLVRVKDTFPNVRIQAVLAMARLQDPQDGDCPTINAYMILLENDSNSEVRRAVLSCIAPSAMTLPKILGRTRDVNENVRKLAYQVLAEKVPLRALSIAQRVELLQQGLNDRCGAVQEVVLKKLLQAWLRLLEGNILELLHRLDIENCPGVAVAVLNAMFALSPLHELTQNCSNIDNRKLIPVENLTCETSLYWRALCEYVKSKGDEGEEVLEQILPEAAIYAEYLYGYLKSIPVMSEEQKADFAQLENVMTKEFIGQQLILLVGCLDTAEEGGRKRVLAVLQEMLVLPNTPASLVSLLIEKLVTVLEDDKRIQMVAEIISEVREPIVAVNAPIDANDRRKRQIKLAGVKVKLIETKQMLEDSIAVQDFGQASELKDKIIELESLKNQLMKEAEEPEMKEVRMEKNDSDTLLKCLTMCSELLKHMSIDKGIGPTMNGILEYLILPGIANAHPGVRNMAVECLGLCTLQNKELAKRHLVLLLQIAQLDDAKIRISALQAVLDQLLLNGMETLTSNTSQSIWSDSDTEKGDSNQQQEGKEAKEPEEEENTVNNILSLLSGFLDSEIPELRTKAAEGLAKLMFCGRLVSSKLLSRLVLLWYNPVTEDDTHLRHCLGVFFPLFAYASRSNQECFEESFLPTMHTLFNAPGPSPLAEVDIANVAKLFIDLTRPSALSQQSKKTDDYQELTVHDRLAVRICNEILKDPAAPDVRIYARCLSTLELATGESVCNKDLLMLLDEVCTEVKDQVCLRALEKCIHQLKAGSKDNGSKDVDTTVNQAPVENGEENVENDGDQLKSTKKRTKRGPKSVSTATRPTRSRTTRRKTVNVSDESDEEAIVKAVPEPVTRSTRGAKAAALENAKMNLTDLMNREANQSS